VSEAISRYREKAAQYWNAFNKSQKIMLISVAVLTILTIILLTIYFSRTEYSLAYTNLDPTDAAAIKNYLDSSGIPYRFSQDGKSIGVPSTMVADVKIGVESQNIIRNGAIGYGIFRDNISSFGMTENQFELLSVDARAGEIQRLIKSMNGVSNALVLLNVPKDSVFLNTSGTDMATASVSVTFIPGFRPEQGMIDTMYNLVSKSVANLPLENISIANANQNEELLPSSKNGTDFNQSLNLAAQQFQIRKQFEMDIQKNVQQLLGTVLGRDKVVVSVVASMNFDKENRQEQIFSPVVDQKGIERSIQEIQKSYSSTAGDQNGGVAGTGPSDIPTYPAASESGTNTNSEELQKTVNFEVNEITKQVIASPYAVKDLTINVGIEPPIPDDPTSLTQETKDAVQRILMNVVAASLADNGKTFTDDDLSRKVMVFSSAFQGKQTLPSETGAVNYLLYGVAGLAFAIAAAGGYWAIRRRKAGIVEEDLSASNLMEQPTIDIENASQENQVRKELESLAKKKPEEFVNLLRTWLVDE
jgi:flagellar M-ring protein FliF